MLYPLSYEGTVTKVSGPGGSQGTGSLPHSIVPHGTVTSYLPVRPAPRGGPHVNRVTLKLLFARTWATNSPPFGRKLNSRPR